MNRNGESWLVHRLSASLAGRSVLDIGANVGDWSAHVHAAAPKAQLHAVEMVPEFVERLRSRFGDTLIVFQCGISDQEGQTVAYKLGGGGRINPGDSKKSREPISVQLRSGDSLVAEEGLSDIALIKIDIEGYDIPALRGLQATIARDRPIIQFEYSRFYIDTRHFLSDAYALLVPLGFRIGRLMPNRIDFLSYNRTLENFATNNYVAVPKESAL